MEYVQSNDEISVVVTRTIKVGQIMKINPSEAYLGVESGNIRVLAIIPAKPDNEEVYTTEVDTEAIIRQIEEYKDVMLDMYDPTHGDEYAKELYRLDNQPWILYQYCYGSKEWDVFPLEEFVDHSMIY